MVSKTKLPFVLYGVGIIIFFGILGAYLSGHEIDSMPKVVQWTLVPGIFFAMFCLVGVHSDHFILASVLANIGVYILVPYLIWKVV